MRWIKAFEAAANPIRNEKLKILKRKVNSILPSTDEVVQILFRIVFNDKYHQKCDNYLIPHMDAIAPNAQRAINIDSSTDNYKSFVFISTNTNAPQYGSNYAGICRLLNDYYMGEVTPVIFEEDKRPIINTSGEEDEVKVSQNFIKPKFSVFVNLLGTDSCDLMFHYQLLWAGMTQVNVHDYNPVLKKENLTKNDILQFIEIECNKFKGKLDLEFSKFEKEFYKQKDTLKDLVSGLLNYKKATILKAYPLLVNMLNLDIGDVDKGDSLADMGFED